MTDIATEIWVTVLVEMAIFAFHFHWEKIYTNDDVICAGLCTKQTRSLRSGEYDL